MNNLQALYYRRQQYEKALPLAEQVVQGRTRIFGTGGVASRARARAGPLEDEQRVANQDPKNPAQMKASTGSPLTDVSAEYRVHVDDGRSVQSFEMSHLQSSTVDCRSDHVMQTDRIRTVGGSRAEYALLLSGAVTSRMHCEHVPTSAIEPGDKNQFIARSDALQPFEDFRFEHQPRCRRAFVGLSGGQILAVSAEIPPYRSRSPRNSS
jgi:hypothetical protein